MKIFGIGTDIVNIKRIDKILKKKIAILKIKFFQVGKLFIVTIKKIQVHTMLKDLRLKRLSLKL